MSKSRFFEHIRVAVDNVRAADQALATLLGGRELNNTDILFEPRGSEQRSRVTALSLHTDVDLSTLDTRGLSVSSANAHPKPLVEPDIEYGVHAVDHVVLMTTDADACIHLFNEQIGMRLALDKTVEKWGGRMLFFREGGLTLEVIQRFDKPPKHDKFWGVAFNCKDLDRTVSDLSQRGLDVGEVRDGRKPGTIVANITLPDISVPCLLIGEK